MKKLVCLFSLGFLALFLHGCASNSGATGSAPYHATGKARVYFYQTASSDATPTVRVDGTAVGVAKAQTSFYFDTTPEEHAVEVNKDAAGSVKFKLDNGGTAYVRLNVADGKVSPEVVDKAVGEKEIATCTPVPAK